LRLPTQVDASNLADLAIEVKSKLPDTWRLR
jgi:hypothetical protein